MSKIKSIPITELNPNHNRHLADYPWNESKVKALQHSIEDVGMWESIIAREIDGQYEMAFGHHRLEAAKRAGLKKVPVIVKALTDKQMLQYMGRENGEDYSTDYLVMLNTWDGALRYFAHERNNPQPVDIARLLGWTSVNQSNGYDIMNKVATACNAGHKMIAGGYINRGDLSGMSVRSASDIVSRAVSRMEAIDKAAKATSRPVKEVIHAKKMVAKGAVATAKQVQSGEIAKKDIKANVDANAYKAAASSKVKDSPLFSTFGQSLSDRINKMLATDSTSEQLSEIAQHASSVVMAEDTATLDRIQFELEQLGKRTEAWSKKIVPTKTKVVSITKGVTK